MRIVAFPYVSYLNTPIGYLQIKASNLGIHHVDFVDKPEIDSEKISTETETCINWFNSYFKGNLLPVNFKLVAEGTAFQKQIWDALTDIKFGDTLSYQDLAIKLGDSNQTRAIANAIAKNPIAVVTPCHRIIGSNKELTGYAWGLKRKKWLLDFEGQISGKVLSLF